MLARALCHVDNAYWIPHVRVHGRIAKTHKTSQTAFRGFGGPQGMFVIEDILGRCAPLLGIAPDELRRRNIYREGQETPYGQPVRHPERLVTAWDQVLADGDVARRREEIAAFNAAHPHAKRALAVTPVKFGISFNFTAFNQAGALVHVYRDGSVLINHGGTEMGQGLHTKMLQVAATALGLPLERVRLAPTRTDKVPNTSATAASSGADLNGGAIRHACDQILARLEVVRAGRDLTWDELVREAYVSRVQLWAAGYYRTEGIHWDSTTMQGHPFKYFAYGVAACEVEVDGFTGAHRTRRVDIVHDVGDSLSPLVDLGQIEGAFVRGPGGSRWRTCGGTSRTASRAGGCSAGRPRRTSFLPGRRCPRSSTSPCSSGPTRTVSSTGPRPWVSLRSCWPSRCARRCARPPRPSAPTGSASTSPRRRPRRRCSGRSSRPAGVARAATSRWGHPVVSRSSPNPTDRPCTRRRSSTWDRGADVHWTDAVTTLRRERVPGVLVTVAAVRGHAPRDAGAKLVVTAERTWGSIGGGNLEETAVARGRALIEAGAPEPESLVVSLSEKVHTDHGRQCCGGEVTLLLEPLPVVPAVAVFGVGHVGLELARILARHDVELHLVDSREAQLSEDRLACLSDALASVHVHHAPLPEMVLGGLPAGTHVLVLTHDHAEDFALCDAALRCSHLGSIGLIGSSAKWARFRQGLRVEGHADSEIDRIVSPIGDPAIVGKEPATIALAVATALVPSVDRSRVS